MIKRLAVYGSITVVLILEGVMASGSGAESKAPLLVSGMRVTVGSPILQNNLAVFPLNAAQKPTAAANYLTLDEALKQNLILVQEMPDKQVNSVRVTNKSTRPIYLLAGDIILGGQQDREMSHDMIIPGHAQDYVVEVFCVEHGRWSGAQHFGTSEFASGSLRYETQGKKDQSQVWNKVAADASAMKADSASGTYRAVAQNPVIQKDIDGYVKLILASLTKDPNAVGFVAAINGKVTAADVFNSHRLFVQELPKILKSYALDAVQQKANWDKLASHPKPTTLQAEKLLRDAETGHRRTTNTSGSVVNGEVENASTINFTARPPAQAAAEPPVHSNIFRKDAGSGATPQPPSRENQINAPVQQQR